MDKTDIIRLHKHIQLDGMLLRDEITGICISVNTTGKLIAELISADGAQVQEIRARISANFKNVNSDINRDIFDFLLQLDNKDMIQIEPSRPQSLRASLIDVFFNLILFRWLENLKYGSKMYKLNFGGTVKAIFQAQKFILLAVGLSGLPMGLLIKLFYPNDEVKEFIILTTIIFPAWLAVVVFCTYVAHEYGHIFALRSLSRAEQQCRLMQKGFKFYIVRRRLRPVQEIIVTSMGPISGFLMGVFLYLIFGFIPLDIGKAGTSINYDVVPITIATMPLVFGLIHMFSLFPFSADGKSLIATFKELRNHRHK